LNKFILNNFENLRKTAKTRESQRKIANLELAFYSPFVSTIAFDLAETNIVYVLQISNEDNYMELAPFWNIFRLFSDRLMQVFEHLEAARIQPGLSQRGYQGQKLSFESNRSLIHVLRGVLECGVLQSPGISSFRFSRNIVKAGGFHESLSGHLSLRSVRWASFGGVATAKASATREWKGTFVRCPTFVFPSGLIVARSVLEVWRSLEGLFLAPTQRMYAIYGPFNRINL